MYIKVALKFAIVIAFVSCSKSGNEDILKQVMDTRIEIPTDSISLLYSVKNSDVSQSTGEYDLMFIHYSDSTMCSECEIQKLGIWRNIMNRANKFGLHIDYRFIFASSSKLKDDLVHYYKHNRIIIPIYIDENKLVEKNNPLMKNSIFHSIIIDSNNKIVKIGDPSSSLQAEEAFYDFLSEYKKSK